MHVCYFRRHIIIVYSLILLSETITYLLRKLLALQNKDSHTFNHEVVFHEISCR